MRKYLKHLISNPLFSGSAIMVIGSNSVNLLNYLYHLILGRMLGPSGYGELASLISLAGLLGIIPISLNLVVIKYVSSSNENEVRNLIGWLKSRILKASFLISLLIILLSPAVASFLHINKITYIILISISFLFSLQALFYRSILQGILKFKEMIISVIVENSTKLLLSIILVYLGFYVGGAVVSIVLATILGWFITTKYLKYHVNKSVSTPSNLKSMMLFTIPVFIQSISTTSIYSSDVILVKHFFSAHDAGIYAALSTLGKIIFFGAGPIGAVMFPLVAQRKSQGKNYRTIFLFSFFTTVILSTIMLTIYWLAPNFAINLLYGRDYLEASNLLIWFGIFITLFTLSSLMISYSLSIGKTRVVLLPLFASIMQVILIWFSHSSLQQVIFISIMVTALLLLFLLIYSTYADRANISNSSSI